MAQMLKYRKRRLNVIRYDLQLLRMLSEPTSTYDVIKKLGYPNSSAYNILKKYLSQGIIKEVETKKLKSGMVKRCYLLTELGISLLGLLEKIDEYSKYDN